MSSQKLQIRRASETDAEQICQIYNSYILKSIITFETEPVDQNEMKKRINGQLVRHDWIVGESNQEIVSFAYYGSFRLRAAYSHTVETTIYVSETNTGKGFGRSLYETLIRSALDKGFRELVGVIALPNPASISLHRILGFNEVGILRGVGHKFGRFVDISLWQKSLT